MAQVVASLPTGASMGVDSETSTQTSPDQEYGRRSDENLDSSSSPQLGDSVKLVFLIQSGDKAEREFKPSETILQVKQSLLDSWPENFAAQPSATSDLRVLYRGHFLDDKATLADSKLLPTSTVVHLTVKPSNKQEKADKKDTDKAPKCACLIL
ncbi:hypothetical protein IWW45_006221 [Coemansia sp. RSA 485]|nr:hypothetical protein IWW45_006221 [Coemansia sp. RSA 485]